MDASRPHAQVYEQDLQRQAEIDEYWTKERLQAARPMPLLSVTTAEFDALLHGPAPPGIQMAPSGDSATLGGAYRVNVDQRPYWNVGKLFFTADDGKDWVGSAAYVGTNKTLMTAAHCVRNRDNGNWFRNFLFIRAGTGHWYGWSGQRVSISRIATYQDWVGPNMKYDYAFCAAASDSGAGWLGLTTNIPYTALTSLGYPTNYDDGNNMHGADGNKTTIMGGTVHMSGNPMGEGCSGGPWVGNLSHDSIPDANIACGLNSIIFMDDDIVGSPYFDANTWRLYLCIQTGIC